MPKITKAIKRAGIIMFTEQQLTTKFSEFTFVDKNYKSRDCLGEAKLYFTRNSLLYIRIISWNRAFGREHRNYKYAVGFSRDSIIVVQSDDIGHRKPWDDGLYIPKETRLALQEWAKTKTGKILKKIKLTVEIADKDQSTYLKLDIAKDWETWAINV